MMAISDVNISSKWVKEAARQFHLDSRAVLVVERRSGPYRETLAEIGNDLHVSRERVRQIHRRAQKRILRELMANEELQRILSALELDITRRIDALERPPTEIDELATQFTQSLRQRGINDYTNGEVRFLIIALRAICESGEGNIWDIWTNLSFSACLIDQPVSSHPLVSAQLESNMILAREERNSLTYKHLAREFLNQNGAPAHWSTIADYVEKVRGPIGFSRGGVFNALVASPEFVRIDSGVYGLADWGLTDTPYYEDLIADVLSESAIPLSMTEIKFHIEQVRPIKTQSLSMYLQLNGRFYESYEGTFGLREWLPPEDQQTLLTPDRLCETDASRRRLQYKGNMQDIV